MQVTPQFLDELRIRIPLVEVVGKRVRLAKRGQEYTGLCPFHNEKTPSFTVSEEKGFFHCFGCGVHGDVITFVMRDEGLEFIEAVEKLAAEAGLKLPRISPQDLEKHKQQLSLYEVVDIASDWFEVQLQSPKALVSQLYLEKRGLSKDVIKKFKLGYAPDSRDLLKRELISKKIDNKLATSSGLITLSEDKKSSYDRFRGRIIFPISDRRGRIVGFGGRALGEGTPKYLNSPETPIFHKGSLLYGLNLARKTARASGQLIVVEGYMDVISLYQAGIKEVVAPLGTALTETQLQELWRHVDEPVLCFDGDEAGRRAAKRVVERALGYLKPGKSLRFVTLFEGEDPDSIVQTRGGDVFRQLVRNAEPLSAIIWRIAGGEKNMDIPERRAAVSNKINTLLALLTDSDMQKFFRKYYQEQLFAPRNTSPSNQPFHKSKTTRLPISTTQKDSMLSKIDFSTAASQVASGASSSISRQKLLLQILLSHPLLAEEFHEELERFPFTGSRYCSLRDSLLRASQDIGNDTNGSELSALARTSLEQQLLKTGLVELSNELLKANSLANDVIFESGVVIDDTKIEKARAQVRHLLDLHYRLVNLESFKQDATESFAANMSEENWNKLVAVIDLLEVAPGIDDELPEYSIDKKKIK